MEDLPAVMEIDRRSFSTPWSERTFEFELTENPAGNMLVAERQAQAAEVIGYIGFWMIDGSAHINTLAVAMEDRRQGVARQLVTTALGMAKEKGATLASLEVRESNHAAQRLYEQIGFEVFGRRKGYYRDTGEDAIIMVCMSLESFSETHGGEV
jgi:ribosomal-protein-alanine N-acetyltransferase